MSGILELKLMARKMGIKRYGGMSKKQLCEKMNIELPERPTKVEFTNRETGEVLKFTSTCKAAKKLNISVGVMYNYTRRVRVGNVIHNVKIYNYKGKKKSI